MAYANGRLPQSALGPITKDIHGVQVYLRTDAAKAFMAMNAESERRFGVTLRVTGSLSAYRNIDGQRYLWDHVAHPHDTNWVAYPGTSNHGWGLAVDLASTRMRQIVDQIGEKYGFAKKWSDAPGEWWHIKWKEGKYAAVDAYKVDKTLKLGSKGPSVIALKKLLAAKGINNFSSTITGQVSSNRYNPFFGKYTKTAVQRFQRANGLTADGVAGPTTWNKLRT